jgi:hypothetical protein
MKNNRLQYSIILKYNGSARSRFYMVRPVWAHVLTRSPVNVELQEGGSDGHAGAESQRATEVPGQIFSFVYCLPDGVDYRQSDSFLPG